jgi:hypothetical protein
VVSIPVTKIKGMSWLWIFLLSSYSCVYSGRICPKLLLLLS